MDKITRARFWAKVDRSGGPDGCWPWTASLNAYGYGQFRIGPRGSKQMARAHRVAWKLVHGPIPEGFNVLHHCDNRPCCNPFRCLFLGTQADNLADMAAKGRSRHGERGTMSKLSLEAVREIRSRYAEGEMLQRELAAEFGVSQSLISHIILGKIWKRT